MACLVVGIIVSAVFGFEALLTGGLDALAGVLTLHDISLLSRTLDESMPSLIGLFAVSWGFLGSGFVLPAPRLSIVFYTVAGLTSMAISGTFPDALIWGSLYLLLAVVALFSWRQLMRGSRTSHSQSR